MSQPTAGTVTTETVTVSTGGGMTITVTSTGLITITPPPVTPPPVTPEPAGTSTTILFDDFTGAAGEFPSSRSSGTSSTRRRGHRTRKRSAGETWNSTSRTRHWSRRTATRT